MAEVTLFDLPSKPRCACWSLNPWKPRLVLNYKNIPYKTEWVEYPDVAPKLKSLGLKPNPNATSSTQEYTIPTVVLHTSGKDEPLMDSRAIAGALEALHPSPSLHLDSPVLPKVEALLPEVQIGLVGVWCPKVPPNLLNPRSVEYFESTRHTRFGMPLAQLETEKGGQQAWDATEPKIRELAELIKAQGGPFCLGKTVSYADFMIVGFLHFLRRIDEDIFDKFVAYDGAFRELYGSAEQWLKNDD